jgi:hypothetical protein
LQRRRIAAGAVGLCAAVGVSSVAFGASAPSKVTVKEAQTIKFKANRYIQDGLRWDKDVYTVKSGGTIHVVNNKANEGPHTFSVVKKSDVPKTAAAINSCKICEKLGQAHGADPNSDAPPKFQYLENGVGQNTAPNVDRPGDSGVTGSGKPGESIDLKVTAKAGSTLYFMCLIHPWMQGKVVVR